MTDTPNEDYIAWLGENSVLYGKTDDVWPSLYATLAALDRPRPFYRRVALWLGGWSWSSTKWYYSSVHGLSTKTFPTWNVTDDD